MLIFQGICTGLSLVSAWASGSLQKQAWIWLFIASACNALLYYSVARYGHMVLDLIYMGCSLWGFALWAENEKITYRISRKEALVWLFLAILGTTIGTSMLSTTFSQDPFIDSLSLVTGVIGVFMMALRRLEQWGIWIVHDLFNVILSMRSGLYLIAAKQGLYLILAIRGYRIWKKNLKSPEFYCKS